MISAAVHEQVAALLDRVASDVVLPHYQNLKASDIAEKSPGDLVTVADKLSEAALSQELAQILPDAAIVGEEAAAENPEVMQTLSDDRVWIIDPIDGTGNFAAGKPPFGMIIALAERGETIAGWLYEPLSKRICHALKGHGAYINAKRVTAAAETSEKPVAALATGFMTAEQKTSILQAAAPDYAVVDIPRCAAEQYPRLVLGENHISVFERTLPWDHAAGVLFLNEAGGKAARWDGSAYLPGDGRTGMLGASSPELWDEAAKTFGGIFA